MAQAPWDALRAPHIRWSDGAQSALVLQLVKPLRRGDTQHATVQILLANGLPALAMVCTEANSVSPLAVDARATGRDIHTA